MREKIEVVGDSGRVVVPFAVVLGQLQHFQQRVLLGQGSLARQTQRDDDFGSSFWRFPASGAGSNSSEVANGAVAGREEHVSNNIRIPLDRVGLDCVVAEIDLLQLVLRHAERLKVVHEVHAVKFLEVSDLLLGKFFGENNLGNLSLGRSAGEAELCES